MKQCIGFIYLAILLASYSHAQVYKCIKPDGETYFTNTQCQKNENRQKLNVPGALEQESAISFESAKQIGSDVNINAISLIAAVIGIILLILTVHYGNKIENRWLRYLAAIIGLAVSVAIMSQVPSLLGDDSIETAGEAGKYLGFLIVLTVVLKSLFFRKR